MPRPGIMIYFEVRKPLAWLPLEDKGKLLDAILEYGEFGVVPEFEGMLGMAWGFIQPRLDKDFDSYENSKAQRQYASFCKKRNGNGLPKVSFEEWQEMEEEERKRRSTTDNETQRPVDLVNGRSTGYNGSITAVASRDPSTSTSTSTSSSAAAARYPDEPDGADAPDAAAAAERHRLEFIQGTLGQGLVKLTPYQFDLLLDELGIEMFDHYVAKLADFIKRRGAVPGNHYNTIRKWFLEDSGTEG